MAIALDVLKAVEMLGGCATRQDLLVLVRGAVAEASSAACVELAQRGKLLQQGGVDAQTVADVYADLLLVRMMHQPERALSREGDIVSAGALHMQFAKLITCHGFKPRWFRCFPGLRPSWQGLQSLLTQQVGSASSTAIVTRSRGKRAAAAAAALCHTSCTVAAASVRSSLQSR
jgi:hypothetical protein